MGLVGAEEGNSNTDGLGGRSVGKEKCIVKNEAVYKSNLTASAK